MARTLEEVDLGSAPSKSTLSFSVARATGFSANALLDCDMKLVASWESVELVGHEVEEVLVPRGLYVLQVSVAFRSPAPVTAELEFGLTGTDGHATSAATSLTGKKGDIGRVIAFIDIV